MSSNRTVRLDFSGVEYHCLDALVFSCLGSFTVTLLGAVAEHWVVFYGSVQAFSKQLSDWYDSAADR